jgi:hypothetical protein
MPCLLKQAGVRPNMHEFSVTIEENGRSGSIKYIEGANVVKFDYEFGGGNCIAIIFGPKEKHWDAAYPWASGRQDQIFTDMSNEVIAQRASGCHAKIDIDSGTVEIYPGKH